MMESDEADRLSPDLLKLHEEEFKQFGFSRVEFKRLISQAEKIEVPVDHPLTREGKRAKFLYYKTGESVVVVSKNGKDVCEIDSHQFIGENSLLTYFHDEHLRHSSATCVVKDKDAYTAEKEAEASGDEDFVGVSPNPNKTYSFFKWDIRALTEYLKQPENRTVRTALMAHLCENMRDKLKSTTDRIARRDTRLKLLKEIAGKSENPERIYAPELLPAVHSHGSNGYNHYKLSKKDKEAMNSKEQLIITHKDSLTHHPSHGHTHAEGGEQPKSEDGHDRNASSSLSSPKNSAAVQA